VEVHLGQTTGRPFMHVLPSGLAVGPKFAAGWLALLKQNDQLASNALVPFFLIPL